MRWGRAIAGGFIAELMLIVAVMPGFALGSETVVTWTAVIGSRRGHVPGRALGEQARSSRASCCTARWRASTAMLIYLVPVIASRPDAADCLLGGARTEDSGRRRRRHVRGATCGDHDHRRACDRMKSAVVAGVLLMLAADAAHAQLRGGLTSRPATRPVTPRPGAVRPIQPIPVWWHWSVVTLPETATLVTPRLAEGAPVGGVQLDVLPWSAEVYVDGELAGRVEEFRGYYHHLEIAAGPHVISIVKPGYDPLTVDVVVVPGRTVTYRATLSRR